MKQARLEQLENKARDILLGRTDNPGDRVPEELAAQVLELVGEVKHLWTKTGVTFTTPEQFGQLLCDFRRRD